MELEPDTKPSYNEPGDRHQAETQWSLRPTPSRVTIELETDIKQLQWSLRPTPYRVTMELETDTKKSYNGA